MHVLSHTYIPLYITYSYNCEPSNPYNFKFSTDLKVKVLHLRCRAFILNVRSGCSSVVSDVLACYRGAWRSAQWRGTVANRAILKPWIFFGNHAEILKWECEMISFSKVWITITAPLMHTSSTGLRNRCCCIHKHFFRTHNNWALFLGAHITPRISFRCKWDANDRGR